MQIAAPLSTVLDHLSIPVIAIAPDNDNFAKPTVESELEDFQHCGYCATEWVLREILLPESPFMLASFSSLDPIVVVIDSSAF